MRLNSNPLPVIIRSTSAAGKSFLIEAFLNMISEEERIQCSAIAGQSLLSTGESNLEQKILAITEEERTEHDSYAMKLLQRALPAPERMTPPAIKGMPGYRD